MLKSRLLNLQIWRLFSTAFNNEVGSNSGPFDLHEEHIEEAIVAAPFLSTTPKDLWYKCHENFTSHGVKTVNFIQMVVGNPSILSRHNSKINESLEIWRGSQFGINKVIKLLTKYPELLDVADIRVLEKIEFVRSFVSSKANVWKLFMNSPNLVSDSEKSIEEKFDYLLNVMRITVPEIVKAGAFSHSLEEIKCRHIFLERLGLFKKRSLKAEPHERSKNPRLYKIIDSSEKSFATKVAGVTLPEYEAFKELYKIEVNKGDYDEELDSD